MSQFFRNNRYFFAIATIFLIAEIIVNPIGNFSLNDDWCYAKTVKILLEEKRLDIGESMASMLTHALWGLMFVKLFGLSFTVLRISTLVSALIALFFLNKIVVNVSGNKTIGVVACLTLLFNPIYFCLSNTFMTDVNFLTLFILIIYFARKFFEKPGWLSFFLVFLFSVLLVLIRQFGIVAPLCFALCCVFAKNKRWLYFSLGMLLFAGVFLVLRFYEDYLRSVAPAGVIYKYSGNYHITEKSFWDSFLANLHQRYTMSLIHFLLYVFPLVIIVFPSLIKEFRYWLLPAFLLGTTFTFLIFRDYTFPLGNIFNNMCLGPDTFVESLSPEFPHERQHNWSATFALMADAAKYFFISFVSSCSLLFIFKLIKNRLGPLFARPFLVFMIGLTLAYAMILHLSEFYFDRYHLPLCLFAIVIFSHALRRYNGKAALALPVVILMAWISVFGAKDYLQLGRTRDQAYHFLQRELKTEFWKINGGWEINGWYEGGPTNPSFFLGYGFYDYLIGYRALGDFKEIGEFRYQRYLPYREDTIRIFIRSKPFPNGPLPEFIARRVK